MDTYELYDIGQSPLLRESKGNNETFPALSVNSRRKVQRHNTFTSRANYIVPEPGNEYDFRRSPEMRYKRQTPSKNGSVRPSVPHDTRTRYAIADREDCYPVKCDRRGSVDESSSPTPMPQGLQPQTAWDSTYLEYYHLSQLMRLWHFSSSVNSFFKRTCAAIQWG